MIARHLAPRTWAAAITLTVAGLTLSACGSGDGDAVGSSTPPTTPTSIGSSDSLGAVATIAPERGAPPAAPADTAPPKSAAPAAPSGDACAAVPSFEQLSAVMGVALSTTSVLDRGPGVGACEAGGASDGVTNVQFSWLTGTTRAETEALAAELGYPVTDLGDPALPGGFTYASTAAVNIDGTEYLVQAIGLDTLGDPNSPVATARSAQLLVLWLANLGVTPVS
jgi:pyruvate/2-oxoglutarate dehydrogenase complex dihydrolipoamide acyltransferase (E2) component